MEVKILQDQIPHLQKQTSFLPKFILKCAKIVKIIVFFSKFSGGKPLTLTFISVCFHCVEIFLCFKIPHRDYTFYFSGAPEPGGPGGHRPPLA